MYEACIGANYAGVVCGEVMDGDAPSRISCAAHWQASNNNPALRSFLSLARSLPDVRPGAHSLEGAS